LAHNTYLEIAAEIGIPCLIIYLWLLYETWRSLERTRRAASEMDDKLLLNLATGMQGGLLGYLVSSFFLSSEYVRFFWFYVFMTIALERLVQAWIASHLEGDAAPSNRPPAPLRFPSPRPLSPLRPLRP
jgi:O-antigen ligase